MRYRILGTTQALRPDGSTLAVGGPRLRALLAVLALRAGRTVPVRVLVDEVWAGEPPADAAGALQALVGRLRRVLGAEQVRSVDGGYRLSAGPEDVDLHRFDRLTAEGRRALAEEDYARAAEALGEALALWQGGEALTDLPDAAAESARWASRRLDARRARLTAELALGRAESVLPELSELARAHPLDEPLQALRLRALREAGRPAEALAAYEHTRRALADRLGTDPGPELRALHAELLSEPTPAPPRNPKATATAAPTTARPGNLRARLTSFVGREADIEAIRADLGRARLVTLLGPGGAGKTRLSQEAAEAVADSAPDGIWLAELAPVEDPAAVPGAVLTALGARETVLAGAGAQELRALAERHGDEAFSRLVEFCAPRRMVLLLDNCEHVIGGAADLAQGLLEHCPRLTVLATSREPLGVPGELLRPVEPLPEPVALRLLAERGASARPGLRIEEEAAAEICRRLDGLPLAIELAAARLRMLTPRQIADRLDDRFRLLTSGSRTVLPRQQTLRAVVDWSWELLDEAERTVLRRLSVFAGGCELAAAEAVSGPAALENLGSLVDKSLVVAAPGPEGPMRYRLLETVGEYAAERLDEAGERAAVERAHLTYYRELARTTDPALRGPGQRAAVARLQLEYENLRTALRHAVAAREEQEALCLVLSLSWYWQIRDLRLDARNWSGEVMALGPDPFGPGSPEAEPLTERCTDAPPPMRPEILAEARRGVHLVHLASVGQDIEGWNVPETQERLRAVARVYRPGLPQTCRAPGSMWIYAILLTGDVERMRAVVDETVAACRRLGYDWELAAALLLRANMLANRSDWAGDARRDAEESLAHFRRIGDPWGAAEALSARGEAHERRGEHARAAEDFGQALAHAEELGAQTQVAVLTTRLANIHLESGDFARGERMLREVVDRGAHHVGEALTVARLFLAIGLGRTGRREEAREQLRLLREEVSVLGFVAFEGFLLGTQAWLEVLDGRHERGLALVRSALAHSRDALSLAIMPQMVSVHLTTAALALVRDEEGGRAYEGIRLYGAAERHLPSGHVPTAPEREIAERVEREGRAALGEARYAAARAEGDGLSLDEAVALV
ncbi:ATP-binding protein [Streptomyces sp. SCSIO ZS0520]|uniref:ATP-binding protein n=1 Tax=Streptomyces sp. SCSIO ZS0520 TaxID=2892996 RepID=UPI0021D976ED|nr:BTAD domain-containing putative transcriptional regulator [Streptomyces sp. SCSIO ZS0520]